MSAETFGDLMAALGAFRKDCLRGEPSNRAIARALGVSPQTVTNWFAGRHFPDQDAEAPVKMVRMIKASAEEQGIAAPEGLLDVDRWREAYRAEAARRQGRTSDAAVRASYVAAFERARVRRSGGGRRHSPRRLFRPPAHHPRGRRRPVGAANLLA
jgi:hypothetical protein